MGPLRHIKNTIRTLSSFLLYQLFQLLFSGIPIKQEKNTPDIEIFQIFPKYIETSVVSKGFPDVGDVNLRMISVL